MDSLRLILLVSGAVLIGGMIIYYRITSRASDMKRPGLLHLFDRFRQKKTNPAAGEGKTDYWDEPSADDIAELSQLVPMSNTAAVDASDVGPMSALNPDALDAVHDGEPLILVLNIMAKQDSMFKGEAILAALESQQWRFGDMEIFHFYPDASKPHAPLCSLANMVEPGTLQPGTLTGMETPGLSLFMQLPGPLEGRAAFELMLQRARALADALHGELCDETRSVLTMQTIGHLKEKIEAFRFKQKMAAIKQQRQ